MLEGPPVEGKGGRMAEILKADASWGKGTFPGPPDGHQWKATRRLHGPVQGTHQKPESKHEEAAGTVGHFTEQLAGLSENLQVR